MHLFGKGLEEKLAATGVVVYAFYPQLLYWRCFCVAAPTLFTDKRGAFVGGEEFNEGRAVARSTGRFSV